MQRLPEFQLFLVICFLLVPVFAGAATGAQMEPLPPLAAYAGASACGECHLDRFEAWSRTYHRNAVRSVRAEPEAILAPFDTPIEGYSRSDVEYVIGGHWYQRYMVAIGDDYYILPKIWSTASQRWDVADAWSWKKKPYSKQCRGCHATRYDPDAKTEVEHQIGCEACHGPGAEHAKSGGKVAIMNPGNLPVEEVELICASCHVRGRDATGRYPFAVGFVPGRNLTDYYQPLAVLDDETPRETFLRTFREWFEQLGKGRPPACDVCGINRKGTADDKLTTSERCGLCHSFPEGRHVSQHPGDIKLECLDCHKEVTRVVADAGDIHSPDTFRVHKTVTYDVGEKAESCEGCH